MSKEQKRLAAVALCIMGIMGTLMAMKDRSPIIAGETPAQMAETQVQTK